MIKQKLLLALALMLTFCKVQAQSSLKTENVILITLDGLRWQELFTGADAKLVGNKEYVGNPEALKKEFWAGSAKERRQILMPFFWSVIAQKGVLYGNRHFENFVNVKNDYWFSYPGYNEILTGYPDEKINSNDKVDNPNVTVLEFINQQKRFKNKVAAFGSWDVFPYIHNEKRSKIPVNAGFRTSKDKPLSQKEKFLNELQPQVPSPWGSVRLDAFTHHYAMEYLKKHQPKLVHIAYGETDDFAHDGEYDAYLKSTRQTDAFIKEVWDWVQSHPNYKNKTTLLITTDHGRGTEPLKTWKHHGKSQKGSDEIWIAAIGPDTPALGEVKEKGQLFQNQVAQTVAAFLGVEYTNGHKIGEVLSGLFKSL
ncbi:sulfatase-like hydrolase/transferase [Rapidithrix thailandica]|uniref:Sulfatase-like hydrolase/transferase n=1 Tax=Rapidithrix thailandica TaxID=413964 RepID=A0AAW9SD44_9BACT